MSVQLKPCPKCGGTILHQQEIYSPIDRDVEIVQCMGCGANTTTEIWEEPRPVEDALRAELAEMKAHDKTKCPNCENCIRNLRNDKNRLEADLSRGEKKYKRITDEGGQEIKDLKEEVRLLAHYKEEVDECAEKLARKDAIIAALDELVEALKEGSSG